MSRLFFVAFLALAATTARVKAQDKATADKWRAWTITKGQNTKLVVEGIYKQGGPGLVVLVKEAVPQGINPKILILDVKTATLPGFWPGVSQPVPAAYIKTPYVNRYDTVHLRYPDGNSIVVDKIIDAGTGPE